MNDFYVVLIVWYLDLQQFVQSAPIISKAVNSNSAHGEVYSIQHYVIKFVSDLRHVVRTEFDIYGSITITGSIPLLMDKSTRVSCAQFRHWHGFLDIFITDTYMTKL